MASRSKASRAGPGGGSGTIANRAGSSVMQAPLSPQIIDDRMKHVQHLGLRRLRGLQRPLLECRIVHSLDLPGKVAKRCDNLLALRRNTGGRTAVFKCSGGITQQAQPAK